MLELLDGFLSSGDLSLYGLITSAAVWFNSRIRERDKRYDLLANKIAGSMEEMSAFMAALSERAEQNAIGAKEGREVARQRHEQMLATLSRIEGMLSGGRS